MATELRSESLALIGIFPDLDLPARDMHSYRIGVHIPVTPLALSEAIRPLDQVQRSYADYEIRPLVRRSGGITERKRALVHRGLAAASALVTDFRDRLVLSPFYEYDVAERIIRWDMPQGVEVRPTAMGVTLLGGRTEVDQGGFVELDLSEWSLSERWRHWHQWNRQPEFPPAQDAPWSPSPPPRQKKRPAPKPPTQQTDPLRVVRKVNLKD